MYADYAIGPLFGRFFHLSTRTAVTPMGNSGGSGRRPVNAAKSVGPAAAAKKGFTRMDEEAMERHAPKAPATAVVAWRGDDSMTKHSGDAVRLKTMNGKPEIRRLGFGEDGW